MVIYHRLVVNLETFQRNKWQSLYNQLHIRTERIGSGTNGFQPMRLEVG